MITAKNNFKTVVIEAVITRADGTKEDLGTVCEIYQPSRGLLNKIKTFISQSRGE